MKKLENNYLIKIYGNINLQKQENLQNLLLLIKKIKILKIPLYLCIKEKGQRKTKEIIHVVEEKKEEKKKTY